MMHGRSGYCGKVSSGAKVDALGGVAGGARLGGGPGAKRQVDWLILAAPAAGGPSGLGSLFSFCARRVTVMAEIVSLTPNRQTFPPMCARIYPAGT